MTDLKVIEPKDLTNVQVLTNSLTVLKNQDHIAKGRYLDYNNCFCSVGAMVYVTTGWGDGKVNSISNVRIPDKFRSLLLSSAETTIGPIRFVEQVHPATKYLQRGFKSVFGSDSITNANDKHVSEPEKIFQAFERAIEFAREDEVA